jgi:hypothetical protein
MSDIQVHGSGRGAAKREREKYHARKHHKDHVFTNAILTKWSGLAAASLSGASAVSYLADNGPQVPAPTTPPSYPFLGSRVPISLTVNLLGFIVPAGGSIIAELLNNGSLIPGFVVAYSAGQTGIRSVAFQDKPFVTNSTFDVRITTSGLFVAGVGLSATVQGAVKVGPYGPIHR